MKVAISGASGFVGSHLSTYLQGLGFQVVPLGRKELMAGSQGRLLRRLNGCEAVFNLAGAPIAHRWTPEYREELIASRVDTTRRLVEAVNRSGSVHTFISASAVGYYPAVGCYDEHNTERGSGFLSRLCDLWEVQAQEVRVRCVVTRFGVVLSPTGGAYPLLVGSMRARVGFVAGSGLRPLSWIALDDLLRGLTFLFLRSDLNGIFNLTAPEKITMRDLIRTAADHYRAWMVVPIPAFMVRWALGEASVVALEGQCAVPQRLLEAGFEFDIPTIEEFLRRLER